MQQKDVGKKKFNLNKFHIFSKIKKKLDFVFLVRGEMLRSILSIIYLITGVKGLLRIRLVARLQELCWLPRRISFLGLGLLVSPRI